MSNNTNEESKNIIKTMEDKAKDIIKEMENNIVSDKRNLRKFIRIVAYLLKLIFYILIACTFILLIASPLINGIRLIDTNPDKSVLWITLSAFFASLGNIMIGIFGNSSFTYSCNYTYYYAISSVNCGNNLMNKLYYCSKRSNILINNIEIIEIKNKIYLKIVYN